jgi:hypothetical protein
MMSSLFSNLANEFFGIYDMELAQLLSLKSKRLSILLDENGLVLAFLFAVEALTRAV